MGGGDRGIKCDSIWVEDEVTSGDYLSAFRLGTRTALSENGRESITITLDELNAHSVGILVALFERAVGLFAELINVNAYDQPGAEAGKKCAKAVLDLQRKILVHLRSGGASAQTAEQIAAAIGEPGAAEDVFQILEHATANSDHCVRRTAGTNPFNARYGAA